MILFLIGIIIGIFLGGIAAVCGVLVLPRAEEKLKLKRPQKKPQIVEFEDEDEEMKKAMELTGAVHE